MKKIALACGALLGALTLAGALLLGTDLFLADLRPAELGPEGSGGPTMSALEHAHGGAEAWLAVRRVSVVMEGTWHSPAPKWRMGAFLGDQPRFRLTFSPAEHGEATLESLGADGRVFVVRSGRSLERVVDGEVDGPWNLPTFVAAIRHLVEMPFAMQSADVRRAVPDAEWNGREHDRVFATWGGAAPQHGVDQYVLWRDGRTGRLSRFDATGRFIMPFATATAQMSGAVEAGGFILPRAIDVHSGRTHDNPLMSWRVLSVELSDRQAHR